MLNHLIQLKMSKPRFKTKKVSHQINKDLFSQENNWKMEEPYQTTTFKKSPPSIWCWDLEEDFELMKKLIIVIFSIVIHDYIIVISEIMSSY